MQPDLNALRYRAYKLRELSLQATTQAGSGHPTSALSAADLIAGLFFYALRTNLTHPFDPTNDRFILSKGHAIPVVYAAWEQLGVISYEELLTLRQFDSVLEGHPTSRFIYNEAATGSLGCGLSIGLGMALAGHIAQRDYYTYVMMGDSEMAEGSIWEAAELASYYKTDHLVAIVDVNRLGQSQETMEGRNTEEFKERFEAFGWYTIVINGHSMEEIVAALDQVKIITQKPKAIIASTIKGYGLDGIEDKNGFHGKAFSKEELPQLLQGLAQRFAPESAAKYPEPKKIKPAVTTRTYPQVTAELDCPYKKDEKIATRKAFGEALKLLGDSSPLVISLDGEVKNSTFADIFQKAHPDRFIQSFIAEQNMVGMAEGFALRDLIPFVSTFGSFFARAHDQLRMAAIGQVPLRCAGSHAGVSIGQDGPSQMAVEDIALFRTLPESIILYPADAVATTKLMQQMAAYTPAISYLRLTRMATRVIYDAHEKFEIGGCKVIKKPDAPVACIVAAGVTLYEALKASIELEKENIAVSIIDAYSIKPLDTNTIANVVLQSQGRLVTVEDHYIQGGLGESVCYELRNYAFSIQVLAVRQLSRSGKPEELLAYHQIDANAIIQTIKSMLTDH